MKRIDIPFRIDEQYENWEFDLDVIENRFKDYDSYKYTGIELNYFLDFSTQKVELIFSADYLVIVIVTFNGKSRPSVKRLQRAMIEAGFKPTVSTDRTYFKYVKRFYYVCNKLEDNSTLLIYGKKRILNKLLPFIVNSIS